MQCSNRERESKKLKYISIALATLIFSGCGGGGGGGSSSSTTTKNTYSGTVVDGYIKGASVKLGSLTATTDANGRWQITTTKDLSKEIVVAKDGIDVDTGEKFEGVLKAPLIDKQVVISPITTVIAKLVEKGEKPEVAVEKVANVIGVEPDLIIKKDPIKELPTNPEAAKVVKTALTIQKAAEITTKAVAGDVDEEKFDQVVEVIAQDLVEDGNIEAEKIATEIAPEKAEVVAKVVQKVVEEVQQIDETKLAQNIEKTAKAIEVVTSAIEDAAKKIATTHDAQSQEIINQEIEKTIKAVDLLGGVEGISKVTEDNVDASTLKDNLLNDEKIDSLAQTYDTLKDAGVDEDKIDDIGLALVDEDTGLDEAIANAGVEVDENVINNLKKIKDDIKQSVNNATEKPDENANNNPNGQNAEENANEAEQNAEENANEAEQNAEENANEAEQNAEDEANDNSNTGGSSSSSSGGSSSGSSSSGGSSSGGSSSGGSSSGGLSSNDSIKTINSEGSSDASNGDITYKFNKGTYTYTISNFGSGDKLVFPSTNLPTIINKDFTDGNVTVQWAADGKVIDVELTGLTTAQDSSILGLSSFESTFGSGCISPTSISSNITEVTGANDTPDDASAGAKYYLIKTNLNNEYTYKIANFGSDDTIDFPDGNEPTVINTNFTDGNVTLQWAYNGSVVKVELSGLSEQNDSKILGLTSFKETFGANSIK